MKQYRGDTSLGLVPSVDLNVFEPAIPSRGQPESGRMDERAMRSMIDGAIKAQVLDPLLAYQDGVKSFLDEMLTARLDLERRVQALEDRERTKTPARRRRASRPGPGGRYG